MIGRAKAQDDPYSTWKMPDNPSYSCCNGASDNGHHDCRPVTTWKDDDGHWRVIVEGREVVVPDKKVMPPDLLHDGRSHWCGNTGGITYCFSPGEPRG